MIQEDWGAGISAGIGAPPFVMAGLACLAEAKLAFAEAGPGHPRLASFRRKPESRATPTSAYGPWTPAFAGVTRLLC